jgi:hypothetical protein
MVFGGELAGLAEPHLSVCGELDQQWGLLRAKVNRSIHKSSSMQPHLRARLSTSRAFS